MGDAAQTAADLSERQRRLSPQERHRRLPGLNDGGGALERLVRIDPSGIDPRARRVRIRVACDVVNPLLGAHSAARVFGPLADLGACPLVLTGTDTDLLYSAAQSRVTSVDAWHTARAGTVAAVGEPRLAEMPADTSEGART